MIGLEKEKSSKNHYTSWIEHYLKEDLITEFLIDLIEGRGVQIQEVQRLDETAVFSLFPSGSQVLLDAVGVTMGKIKSLVQAAKKTCHDKHD